MGYEAKLVKPAIKVATFLDKFPKIYNIYVVAIISCISGMMFGFDIASMSAFIGIKQYRDFFNSPDSNLQGIISASMALGSIFGSLASSFVSEPFGRRVSLFLCAFFWVVGAAIQSSVQNVAQLIIGRFISGFGVGFGSTVAPVYGSELSPRKIRGLVGCCFQFSVTLGILIMFYISYGLHFVNGTASFRIAWGLQIVPGLVLILGLFFIPESPRWMAKQGFWDKCESIVAEIHAKGDKDDPDVLIEVAEIKDQLQSEKDAKSFTYADLFTKRYIGRTTIAVFGQIWQQLTGMNTLMYYIVYIFQMAGYSGNTLLVSSSIQYVLNTVMTIPAFYLIDRFGRRPILLIGATLMMAFQFAIGGILASYSEKVDSFEGDTTIRLHIPKSQSSASKGVIASCYLFVVSFASTWGVCIWVYCAEIWGDNLCRQRGAAVATSLNWMFNFAIAMFTPSAFKNITWKTYFVFATFCGTMFIHVFFFFPETKGKRLEEIGQMWDAGVPAWKTASWKPTVPLIDDDNMHEKFSITHGETGGTSSKSSDGASNNAHAV